MRTLKINSIIDVVENIEELAKPGYLPHEIMDSVLNAFKVSKTNPDFGNFKGEIGMAYMYDSMKYQYIIKAISESPDLFRQDVSME